MGRNSFRQLLASGQTSSLTFGPGEWFALGAAIAFAAANVLTRVAAEEGNAIAGTVIRLFPVALLGLAMMVRQRGGAGPSLVRRANFLGWTDLGLLVFYSLVVAPLAHVFLFLAFRFGGVLVAVPFFSTFPLIGALIAVPFLGEMLNRQIVTGIILTIVGIASLTYGQYTGVPVSSQWRLGALFGLLTALMWAMSSNLSGRLLRKGVSVYTVIGVTMTVSAIILTMILALSGQLESLQTFSTGALWSLLFSGLLLGLAQYFLFSAFALTTVASASTIKTLDVGLATAAAVLLLDEVINLPIGLGILLVIGGIILVQVAKAAPQPGDEKAVPTEA